ncbi:trypsin-like peptidase domain-containing protein [Bdellovibrionota bacterium FG-1]
MKEFSYLKVSAAIALVVWSSVTFSMMSACGHKGADSPAPSQNTAAAPAAPSGAAPTSQAPTISTPGIVQATRVAREAQVSCAEGQICPPGVGMVVSTSDGGVNQCTGFLVASDWVMTASVCVSEAVREGKESCMNRVRVHFPENSTARLDAQDVDCSSISFIPAQKKGDGDKASFVFIHLASSVDRDVLKVSAEGLKEGMKVSVPVVDPSSVTRPIADIRVNHCRVVQRAVVLPDFKTDLNLIGALGECRVESGAFGAPVLDSDGQVHAMVHGGTHNIELVQLAYHQLLGNNQIVDFAFVTNLACVLFPYDHEKKALSSDCAPSSGLELTGLKRVITPDLIKAALKEVDGRITPWKKWVGHTLRWELPTSLPLTVSSVVSPFPTCIANADRWLSKYKHWYYFGGYDSKAQVEVPILPFQVDYWLNSYAQTDFRVTNLPSQPALISFNPQQIAKEGKSFVTIRAKGQKGQPGALLYPSMLLKKCGN